jgi:cytoplasmic tRNA 2-thiolation protein 1
VAIGASGGKDSTVLASVLKTLNERYDYGLELILLSIDEGIKGYRDDSLETVKRNAIQYDMPLQIVSYGELYGWTMDQVVAQVGKKGNCTYCGVFRRQALDRGAARLGVNHVVTGHNADDVAETVLMNLLRGDLPRLARTTSIITQTPGSSVSTGSNAEDAITNVKRSKPLKYAYEKEIVLYAHHKGLDYFSTECIYSPEAFRGSARALIKNLERIRPSAILDIVRSGEDIANLVPGAEEGNVNGCSNASGHEEDVGGCSSAGRNTEGDIAAVERHLVDKENATTEYYEIEVTREDVSQRSEVLVTNPVPSGDGRRKRMTANTARKTTTQVMGRCANCGYLSSQVICKACVLLEGLNKSRPKQEIEIGNVTSIDMENMSLSSGMDRLRVDI